jgi:methylmalonyl-CoA mutase N-terminal domain/subunit
MNEDQTIPTTKIDANLQHEQERKLKELRATRNQKEVDGILNEIQMASCSGENLFPLVINAVRLRATLGEIMDSMKREFGEYMSPSGF